MKIVQNNKNEILRMLDQATDSALWAIGAEMEANAKKYETRVDTGRLRNSISHAETDDTVYVGTNVKYAPVHELGGRTHFISRLSHRLVTGKKLRRRYSALHFLQRSVSNHIDRYKAILEASLKE